MKRLLQRRTYAGDSTGGRYQRKDTFGKKSKRNVKGNLLTLQIKKKKKKKKEKKGGKDFIKRTKFNNQGHSNPVKLG